MPSVTIPFAPVLNTVTRSVNTGSQSVALGTAAPLNQDTPTAQGAGTFPGGFSVRVLNAGSVVTFIAFGYNGTAATAAVASSIPMLPASSEVFTVPAATTHISAIVAATTSTVYATPGQGGV